MTLKEALERIRNAELRNEQAEKELLQTLSEFRLEKENELKQLSDSLKNQRKETLEAKEEQKQERLELQKATLLSKASEDKKNYQITYEQNHEVVVDDLLERVKQIYGS
ncbi:MAG: hypothetical protein ACK5MW_06915 [Enterococcus sp.]